MTNFSGGGAPGCGHPQKPGTRFCTTCGQPAPASADAAHTPTQTVTVPRRVPPQPGSQYSPGPQWPQGPAPRPAPPAGPGGPPDGPRRSPWLLAAGIAASVLLVGGAGGGAYLFAARGQSPAPVTANTSAPVANTSAGPPASSAPVTPASTASTGPVPATTAATTTPPPAVTEQQAATRLAGLLARSAGNRNAIISATNDAANCGPALSQDAQTLHQAAASRRALISQLDRLPGAQTLPAQMLSDLRSAWQASATADDDYARWAGDEASGGCTKNDPWYTATGAPNQQATNGKVAFIASWNPIAARYNLTQYTQGQL
jgi:hypothetical protein